MKGLHRAITALRTVCSGGTGDRTVSSQRVCFARRESGTSRRVRGSCCDLLACFREIWIRLSHYPHDTTRRKTPTTCCFRQCLVLAKRCCIDLFGFKLSSLCVVFWKVFCGCFLGVVCDRKRSASVDKGTHPVSHKYAHVRCLSARVCNTTLNYVSVVG